MSLTIVLIIMTSIISYQAFSNADMRQKLILHPASIKEFGQWHRFLTHGFIHADWGHLILNMYVLYIFGEDLEFYFNQVLGPMFGRLAYLFMYLTAIVLSSIPSYLRHQDNYGYSALGASGATSAVVFGFVLFNPWLWFLFPPLPAIIFAVGYLWYSSYMDKRGGDNIGHNAHFWGSVYGLLFTITSMTFAKPEMLEFFVARLLEGPSGLPF
ncbi:MAG: rhomboid family intramembrane serine protease [Bacteroidota bacterium]